MRSTVTDCAQYLGLVEEHIGRDVVHGGGAQGAHREICEGRKRMKEEERVLKRRVSGSSVRASRDNAGKGTEGIYSEIWTEGKGKKEEVQTRL